MNKDIVEKYQCPGCVCGGDTACGSAHNTGWGDQCDGHVPGTSIVGLRQRLLIGMPRGYNKLRRGCLADGVTTPVRIFPPDESKHYGPFDVPVWSMQHGDNVLVRTFQPRTGVAWIDIHPNAKREDIAPESIDSSTLEMD